MKNTITPEVQNLLDELTEQSYLNRQKEIAKQLRPYHEVVIPLLIKRMHHNDDNSEYADTRYNAIQILALSADYRSILPLLRYIEAPSEQGWIYDVFNLLRQSLRENKEYETKEINNQLIQYLKEGVKIQEPEPFDPVESEKSFNELISALMKQTGTTEEDLDDELKELVSEVKEKLVQPVNFQELNKDKIPQHELILVEVIDTLSEFGGLQEFDREKLLENYIKEYGFHSIVAQHALTALSKTNLILAQKNMRELEASCESRPDLTTKRVVYNKNADSDPAEFTICVRNPGNQPWEERPYYFKVEDKIIFFLARGDESYKWFAGEYLAKDQAIELASNYLKKWLMFIDVLNTQVTGYGKYSRLHVAGRYSECLHLIQEYISFEKWGFEQTHISQRYEHPHERPQIIYQSEWCRVKFSFRSYGEMHDQSDVLNILYGRLHAADKEDFILWNGELHHCWHPVSLALCFLDDMSTEEAAKVFWNHPVIENYKKSKEMQNVSQPSKEAELHAVIWEKYGQQLFELFDLRRPDLWDKYSVFIKKVYEVKGFKSYGGSVPREKIC